MLVGWCWIPFNHPKNPMTWWVEEILHHLGWLKPYQSWDKRINHLSTGAGFLSISISHDIPMKSPSIPMSSRFRRSPGGVLCIVRGPEGCKFGQHLAPCCHGTWKLDGILGMKPMTLEKLDNSGHNKKTIRFSMGILETRALRSWCTMLASGQPVNKLTEFGRDFLFSAQNVMCGSGRVANRHTFKLQKTTRTIMIIQQKYYKSNNIQ